MLVESGLPQSVHHEGRVNGLAPLPHVHLYKTIPPIRCRVLIRYCHTLWVVRRCPQYTRPMALSRLLRRRLQVCLRIRLWRPKSAIDMLCFPNPCFVSTKACCLPMRFGKARARRSSAPDTPISTTTIEVSIDGMWSCCVRRLDAFDGNE